MAAIAVGVLVGLIGPARSLFGGDEYRVETEHLVLEWSYVPDTTEIAEVRTVATEAYDQVAELLGEQPERKVWILLRGPSERPDGTRDFPRVDPLGRIQLFRFTPDVQSYFGALAHEMVHAFRFDRRVAADWFFEEGLAEFVALRADSPLSGFPWFEYPVVVVAGQWVAGGQDIPLSTLRERHDELNSLCTAQSYALRSAFFDWLGKAYGDESVLEAARAEPAGALADYERIFGAEFDQLVLDWRESVLAEYGSVSGVEDLAERYRVKSPIRYQHVCLAGEDY